MKININKIYQSHNTGNVSSLILTQYRIVTTKSHSYHTKICLLIIFQLNQLTVKYPKKIFSILTYTPPNTPQKVKLYKFVEKKKD